MSTYISVCLPLIFVFFFFFQIHTLLLTQLKLYHKKNGKYLAGITPFLTLTLLPPQITTPCVHRCSQHSLPLNTEVQMWPQKLYGKKKSHSQIILVDIQDKLYMISVPYSIMIRAFSHVVKNLLKTSLLRQNDFSIS